jgi:hypothetical protein
MKFYKVFDKKHAETQNSTEFQIFNTCSVELVFSTEMFLVFTAVTNRSSADFRKLIGIFAWIFFGKTPYANKSVEFHTSHQNIIKTSHQTHKPTIFSSL